MGVLQPAGDRQAKLATFDQVVPRIRDRPRAEMVHAEGAGGNLATESQGAFQAGERVVLPFGAQEAALAAELYRTLPRARGREVHLAIAPCALSWGARLWTLNKKGFDDVPGLELI